MLGDLGHRLVMRVDLVAYVDGGGLDLTPLAAAAAEQLRVGDAKP